jgi:hypothetical protein
MIRLAEATVVSCNHPDCAEKISQWSQCPIKTCSLDIGFCSVHGGRSHAEEEMRLHILGHGTAAE